RRRKRRKMGRCCKSHCPIPSFFQPPTQLRIDPDDTCGMHRYHLETRCSHRCPCCSSACFCIGDVFDRTRCRLGMRPFQSASLMSASRKPGSRAWLE
ncbi:hypothetical protein PENTCL1PPCAC_14537, partial [Pristionchus entomophagus]